MCGISVFSAAMLCTASVHDSVLFTGTRLLAGAGLGVVMPGYMNQDQPSPRRLLRMLQTEFIPEPEYGNTLTQPVALEMKKVLNSDF